MFFEFSSSRRFRKHIARSLIKMFIFIDLGGLEGSPDPANAKNMDFVEVSISSAWDYSEISLMSHGTIAFDFLQKSAVSRALFL